MLQIEPLSVFLCIFTNAGHFFFFLLFKFFFCGLTKVSTVGSELPVPSVSLYVFVLTH